MLLGMVLLCCSLFHQRLPFKRAAFFVNVQLYSNIRNYFAWVGLICSYLIFRNPISFTKHQAPTSVVIQLLKTAADSRCSASAASGNQRGFAAASGRGLPPPVSPPAHSPHSQPAHSPHSQPAHSPHSQLLGRAPALPPLEVMTVTPTFPPFGEITTAS